MKEIDTDVLIIGAGLIGLIAAHCLSALKYNIVIVEKKNPNINNINKGDTRTVAISEGSKQFLESLLLWDVLKKYIEPIKKIKVFDRGPSNKILFENLDKKQKLGYVIQNSKFHYTLLKKLNKKRGVKIFYGTELIKINTEASFSKTYFKNQIIKSKLIIAADGKKSQVRKIVGNKIFEKKYPESALVLNFLHEKNLNQTAYEIFYDTGPLAILPVNSANRFFQSSIIWSNNDSFVEKLIKCDDFFIKEIISEKVSQITGKIIKINSKQKFPLSAHINDNFFNNRLIYVGDSAHSIHPIAGQGWNLGVKDLKNLYVLCGDLISKKENIGDKNFCKRYNQLSYKNAFQLYQITDKLNYHFKRKQGFYRFLSNTGFDLIEYKNSIKNKITKYAMGL